jgi:hypothetical protein
MQTRRFARSAAPNRPKDYSPPSALFPQAPRKVSEAARRLHPAGQPAAFRELLRHSRRLCAEKKSLAEFWWKHAMDEQKESERSKNMSIWLLILLVVGWIVLQAFVLPKFGIST